jgi:hypothetical protein
MTFSLKETEFPRKSEPKTRPRKRKGYQIRLPDLCAKNLDMAAKANGCTRSRMVEMAFEHDFASLFEMFQAGKDFAQIVIETHLAPWVVRLAFAEYNQGFSSEACDAPVLVEAKKTVALERLRVDKSRVESRERIERMKLETKEKLAEKRRQVEEERAQQAARQKRLETTFAPRFPVGGSHGGI